MENLRELRRQKTARAAHAFVEDLAHFRAVLAKDTCDIRELRQLSIPLRRLICNGELRDIATARLEHRPVIIGLDLEPMYSYVKRNEVDILVAGDVSLFGIEYKTISARFLNYPTNARVRRLIKKSEESGAYPVLSKTDMNVGQFSQQKVCYFIGRWTTRNEIIKHVAIHGAVAHTADIEDDNNIHIARLGNAFRIGVDDPDKKGFALHFDDLTASNYKNVAPEFKPLNKVVDALSIQLLITISVLVGSPDIVALEQAIIGGG